MEELAFSNAASILFLVKNEPNQNISRVIHSIVSKYLQNNLSYVWKSYYILENREIKTI